MGKLLLVDGSALLHRAYHAYPSLRTKTGQATGAVYGVVTMLIAALESENPEKVVVAWDLPAPTFRHEKYIGYKANRAKSDEEMVEQIPTVKEVIEKMGIVQLEEAGYEADDIIGTLASKSQDTEVVILSGDMDLTQLVNKRVKMLSPARGKTPAVLYGEEEVEEKLGVKPGQVVDYKALVGDSSDNIPGVRGIGPKTAGSLLSKYGDLERIYENLDKLKERVREKLVDSRESAYLSQDLATIRVDMEIEEGECEIKEIDKQEGLKEMFKELGFRSLIRRVWGDPSASSGQGKSEVDERQGLLF